MSQSLRQQELLSENDQHSQQFDLEKYSQRNIDNEEIRSGLSQDSQSSPLLDEKNQQDDPEQGFHRPRQRILYQLRNGAILAFLLSTCITNIILLTRVTPHERSKYADLATDVPTKFEWATEYSNPNLSEAATLWEAISFDVGMVALPYT
ncbi:hypothetical protein MMC13_007073 [Lambiella insularis]|nr:hypothetical protein [Lambiella insularis]